MDIHEEYTARFNELNRLSEEIAFALNLDCIQICAIFSAEDKSYYEIYSGYGLIPARQKICENYTASVDLANDMAEEEDEEDFEEG